MIIKDNVSEVLDVDARRLLNNWKVEAEEVIKHARSWEASIRNEIAVRWKKLLD